MDVSSTQVRASDAELVDVFYHPVHDMALLCQASAVESSLDPLELARDHDRWKWCCTLPSMVEKLWADLYELRKKKQRAAPENGQRSVNSDLLEGCMHFYATIDTLVLEVKPELAGRYMHCMIGIHNHLHQYEYNVLSSTAQESDSILDEWQQGKYQNSLALYFTAQIKHALKLDAPPSNDRMFGSKRLFPPPPRKFNPTPKSAPGPMFGRRTAYKTNPYSVVEPL